jgi:hypothetical protein
MHSFRIIFLSSLLLVYAFCFTPLAQASLTNIGNGLIYDSNADVTWISNGLYFSDTFKTSPNSLGLIGSVVTAPGGSPHTVDATDFTFVALLNNRELADWWGATAWANNLQYQYGATTVTGWALPTHADLTSLWSALGTSATFGANIGPFTYVLPKTWTSDGTTATTANYADFTFSTSGSAPIFGTVNLSNTTFSNGWAVYHGNVANLAAVPIPSALWLFSSALAGLSVVGRNKRQKSLVIPDHTNHLAVTINLTAMNGIYPKCIVS